MGRYRAETKEWEQSSLTDFADRVARGEIDWVYEPGTVWLTDLDPPVGREQCGTRRDQPRRAGGDPSSAARFSRTSRVKGISLNLYLTHVDRDHAAQVMADAISGTWCHDQGDLELGSRHGRVAIARSLCSTTEFQIGWGNTSNPCLPTSSPGDRPLIVAQIAASAGFR